MLNKNEAFRKIPAVHKILDSEEFKNILSSYPRDTVTYSINEVLRELKDNFDENDRAWTHRIRLCNLATLTKKKIELIFTPSMKSVINATGIVLHTNLGRAPLSQRAIDAVVNIASNYSNLEYDIKKGERGSRHTYVEQRICKLTDAESAVVVNNNAAAVLLVLNEMGFGGEAIVSRGQLVEIGGSFRIPDIMESSGVKLKEVGSTNKTKLRDYEKAVSENTKMILRVHTSNYRIVGFTEQPELSELVNLARKFNLPVVEDIGSGSLYDFTKKNIGDEPTVRASIKAGVDIVTFSGDKLLGGAQAGIIIGKKEYIDRIKQNPLMRALRVDKMTLAALEATLIDYEDESLAEKNIPIIKMLTEDANEILIRCARMFDKLNDIFEEKEIDNPYEIQIEPDVSRIGGGALPQEELPTHVLRISCKNKTAQELFDDLRLKFGVPIITRISQDKVIVDLRTVFERQENEILKALMTIAKNV